VRKKIFFFIPVRFLFLLLLSGSVYAQQEGPGQKTDFSVQLSVTRPHISMFREIYRPNLNIGTQLFVNRHFHPHFSFSGGIGLTGAAYSRQATDSNLIFTQRTREWYTEVPVNIWYWPEKSGAWGIFAGLTPSFLLGKKADTEEIIFSVPRDPSAPGRADFAVQGGARISLNRHLYIGASYSHSFTGKQRKEYNSGRFSFASFSIGVNISPQKVEKEQARKQTDTLKAPAAPEIKAVPLLLVRLKTNAKRAGLLASEGYPEEAAKLKARMAEENDSLRQIFKRSLSACEVYFFYDTSSKDILNKNYTAALHDFREQAVSILPEDSVRVLIGEFGSPYSDAFQSSSGYGLVIYDHRFGQMLPPFPFYTNTFFGLLGREEVILKFNRRLLKYLGSR
jgi:hypothetical protein